MKFIDFLREQKENHAVLAFGRMNPITSGHEKLVKTVKDLAKTVGGSHHIVLSHSQDSQKNPLSGAQKLKHAERAFPGTNFSVSTKEHPNFLKQAEKLHHAGVTHLHMVGGSDRVAEFKKTLKKYNGTGEGKLFNFKKIEVHSAGDRDPDAEGVSGMSASKMREHAKNNKFTEFKKGVPSSMSHEHAKQMYNDVRKGMSLKEDLNLDFEEELLNEGVHDKAIFKVVFLAGGPGSGKDYVLDNTLAGHGLTELNSDKALEYLMDKKGLDKTMPTSEKTKRDLVRGKAKSMTELRQRLAIYGRNGLIINGTGDDVEKIANIKNKLEELGYESSMLMVNTADDVSMQRNIERGQRGGRTVPEEVRKKKWQESQNSRAKYAEMFKDNYVEFDNSEDLRTAAPDVVKAKKEELDDIYKKMQKFTSKPAKTETSKAWISSELERKDLLKVDKTKEVKMAHPSSKASDEAKKMGLDYYGFGRYGKQGKVTYRSVHDRLTPVELEKPKINEEFESMLQEEKKSKYFTDDNGKIRTFMLRRAAAKQAHTINGTVIPFKNGYVIKLNEENTNVKSTSQLSENQTNTSNITMRGQTGRNESGRTKSSFEGNSCLNEETTTKQIRKLTLTEIRAKQKEKIVESIDKGIEPGLSMAGAGESIARDMGEKIKKKTGKASQVTETIGAGGEDATSVSDNNELKLKRKGINLQSFKTKNYL
jgi:nicotinamide mononucleotide adenylyltransferase